MDATSSMAVDDPNADRLAIGQPEPQRRGVPYVIAVGTHVPVGDGVEARVQAGLYTSVLRWGHAAPIAAALSSMMAVHEAAA